MSDFCFFCDKNKFFFGGYGYFAKQDAYQGTLIHYFS